MLEDFEVDIINAGGVEPADWTKITLWNQKHINLLWPKIIRVNVTEKAEYNNLSETQKSALNSWEMQN